MFSLAKKYFSEINRENIVCLDDNRVLPAVDTPKSIVERKNVSQGKIAMGFTSEVRGNIKEAAALSLFSDIFGGGPYSRLFSNVREKMSLCYYCSSITEHNKGILIAECGTQNEDKEKAQNAILQEIENIKNGIFTDEELNNTKKSLITSCKAVTDSVGGIISWNFSNKMSGNDKL